MNRFLVAFFLSALLIGTTSNKSFAGGVTIEELKTQAEAEYKLRDYNDVGIKHAQAALDKYDQLLKMTSDAEQLAEFNLGVAKSVYFVGDSMTDKASQKQLFLAGMNAADLVLKNFGIANTNVATLTDALAQNLNNQFATNKDKMDMLAEALYQKAANLGQWGQTDIVGALFRWPELRNINDFITKISYASKDSSGKTVLVSYKFVHSFAAYRIVGRAYFVIPNLLGGDKVKSEKYLELAVKSSMAVDAFGKALGFSTNGSNNIYYTDTLRANGKTKQAKDILTVFVTADPKDLKIFPNPEDMVDVIKDQKDARAILSKL